MSQIHSARLACKDRGRIPNMMLPRRKRSAGYDRVHGGLSACLSFLWYAWRGGSRIVPFELKNQPLCCRSRSVSVAVLGRKLGECPGRGMIREKQTGWNPFNERLRNLSFQISSPRSTPPARRRPLARSGPKFARTPGVASQIQISLCQTRPDKHHKLHVFATHRTCGFIPSPLEPS